MKKLGRNKGKRSYAVVDSKNRIQTFLDSGGLQKIYLTKVSASHFASKEFELKVVPIEIKFISTKSITKKKK